METWMTMILWAFGLFVFCVVLSVLASMYMARSIAKFSVKVQEETIVKLRKQLGGRNCGECGCESCEAYAIAMFYGQRGYEACPYASENAPEKIQTTMQEFSDFLEGKDQLKRPNRLVDRVKMWNTERKKRKQIEE